ncbi:MAG TPA: PilZ domain-containing protein [Polyangiaceae bacterium]|nr:PilZ domain-containing protein [Polyangiaceae bacterium]
MGISHQEANMERRINIRANLEFPVVCISDQSQDRGRAINVSSTGILVERPAPSNLDPAPVTLALALPHRKGWLTLRAKCVWSDGRRHAYRFIDTHPIDHLELAEMIDWVARIRASAGFGSSAALPP